MLKATLTKPNGKTRDVLLRCFRTFGGKHDSGGALGSVFYAFEDVDEVTPGMPHDWDFNGPAAKWVSGVQNEVQCYEALKAAINAEGGYAVRGGVLTGAEDC